MFHVSSHIFLQPADVASIVCCLLTTTAGWSYPTGCIVYGLVLLLEVITGFVSENIHMERKQPDTFC
jgi:hypothetical protein